MRCLWFVSYFFVVGTFLFIYLVFFYVFWIRLIYDTNMAVPGHHPFPSNLLSNLEQFTIVGFHSPGFSWILFQQLLIFSHRLHVYLESATHDKD